MARHLLTHHAPPGGDTVALAGPTVVLPGMEATVRIRSGAAPLVVARGELDIATARAFEELVIETALRHGPDVLIEGSGISFCDARGLGALVRCANEARRTGGRLTLVHPSHRLVRLLRIVGLDHLM